MNGRTALTALLLATLPALAQSQEWSGEGHASYSRTTQSYLGSWGAGAQLQALFGAKTAPVQLGTSLGGDYLKQENSGPSSWSLGYDATLQPGGGGAFVPYAGGGISANWFSGNDAPSGTLLGLEYIVGIQVKPDAQSSMTLRFEGRAGYVKTQEHTVTGRFGIAFAL